MTYKLTKDKTEDFGTPLYKVVFNDDPIPWSLIQCLVGISKHTETTPRDPSKNPEEGPNSRSIYF